jgi:hypothetical protein
MAGKSIEEWFKMSRKSITMSSTGRKAMVDTFPLIVERTNWRIDGRSIRVGEDPWEGSTGDFKLFEDLVGRLHNQGVFLPRDGMAQGVDVIDQLNWKTLVDLNLEGDWRKSGMYLQASLKQILFLWRRI